MRKILLITVIVILLTGFGYIVVNGMSIANFDVLGFKQIKEEDETIEEKNSKLSKLVNEDYQKALETLATAEKSLKSKKEEYESKILLSSDSSTGYVATIEKYEIEFLWTRLGNHAKDNGVDMKIELTNSSMGTGYYKMNFTAIGSYVGITDFIYAIENDSELGFKIDNFIMTSGGANNTNNKGNKDNTAGTVTATFSCDEIAINIKSIEQNTNVDNTENSESKQNTNTNTNTNTNASTNTSANTNASTNTKADTTKNNTSSTTNNVTN